jgi:4-hydroxy-3-polyprenylbenzoate decarboxylase
VIEGLIHYDPATWELERNRVLIDATRSWKFDRRPEWGNERFPPTVRPAPEDEARVRARWDEYGLGDL